MGAVVVPLRWPEVVVGTGARVGGAAVDGGATVVDVVVDVVVGRAPCPALAGTGGGGARRGRPGKPA